MNAGASAEQSARQQELAAFLKSRRESLQPEDVGIPRRGRRRVQGLRRHEVADIAAVSVTWYTWLEQARDIRTTPQVIDALARALLLDADGHRYLRRLAGVPMTEQAREPTELSDGLRLLVDNLSPHPAHLMEPSTDLLAWNAAYARLFTDPFELDPDHRNGLWIQVMSPDLRARLANWEHETELAIARFRAAAGKYSGDPRFSQLVDELNEKSDFFKNMWSRHEVHGSAGHLETVEHPVVGAIHARLLQLRPLDHPHLILMIHQLADDESQRRMTELLETT